MSWLEHPVEANALQWDGRTPGNHEAYHLHILDPDSRAAWWLRYTLEAPLDGDDHSSLWGAHFSAGKGPRRFALRTRFPARSFGHQSDGFHIRVSKSELTRTQAKGGLRNPSQPEHVLRWNVRMRETADPLQVYAKERAYRGRDPPTKITAPLPMARASGVIEAGDERYALQNARALQEHVWGSHRFERWTWGYATLFRERSRAYVYALQAVPERGDDPFGVVHYVDEDGTALTFHKVKTTNPDGVGQEPGVWTFEAKRRGWRISGRFSASLQRMLGVRYDDPDGTVRYCHHGGIADATFEIWKSSWGRKELDRTLSAKGTAIFEQGGLRPFDDVEFFV